MIKVVEFLHLPLCNAWVYWYPKVYLCLASAAITLLTFGSWYMRPGLVMVAMAVRSSLQGAALDC